MPMEERRQPYTKPVIVDPYYDRPCWLEHEVERKEFIILSADSRSEDVELFLILLFGYNHIDEKPSFEDSFHELFKEEYVVISGGIGFFLDPNTKILPSCCCGLEDWSEVYQSVRNRTSPWLGHDPSPGITYQEQTVRVWADDPESIPEGMRQGTFFIDYKYEELVHSLEQTKKDLSDFVHGPLHHWMNRRNRSVANKMTQKMLAWFIESFDSLICDH